MKRSKLCGLLLALFTIFGLSLSVSSSTSALRHNYAGVPLMSPSLPYEFIFDSNSHSYSFDWSASGVNTIALMPTFFIQFQGDSYQSDYDNLSINTSNSILSSYVENNQYYYNSMTAAFNFIDSETFSSNLYFFPDNYTNLGVNSQFYTRKPFGQDGKALFNNTASGLLRCYPFNYRGLYGNGAVCDGLWNTAEYINSEILPYYYGYDGFYISSSAIDTDSGIHYSHSFSLSDLFNQDIPTFSRMQIPLWDFDGYFWDSNNLYNGRSFEFTGAFEFDGSFDWHSDINNNGSYFRVYYSGLRANDPFNSDHGYFDCTINLITLSDLTRLEYSCPYVLPADYIAIGFTLDISGNGNYVWTTDDDWHFAYSYVVTDNDDTLGYSFNSHLTGGGSVPGSASNDIIGSGCDFIHAICFDSSTIDSVLANFGQNISNLFLFNLFNPFSFLFTSFSDASSCASIPIISGMLHAEESTICPFFDSSVRAIGTGVFSLVSVMLLFGFIIRWLRSSNSDFSPISNGGDS